MAEIIQPDLFSWKEVETQSDLDRLKLVLSVLPDEALMQRLEDQRGNGRDDYPIRPTWNALIAGIVYDHKTAASLLRELRRNAELRQMCGFDPHLGALAAPSEDAWGRFLKCVMDHQDALMAMFHALVDQLKAVLPDLGRTLAGDSKAIPSFGKPVRDEEKRKEPDRRRDIDADWGKKTYRGQRKDGSLWEKVKSWFGYKLHLLVDSTYELPLSFYITQASSSDQKNLLPLVEDLQRHHPDVAATAQKLSADKGYDSAHHNRELYDTYDIVPIIDARKLWSKEQSTRPLNAKKVDVVVYDEAGQLSCHCPATGDIKPLAFAGFEKDRKTLKYRCPAAALGCTCPGRAICEAGKLPSDYGRIFRVPLEKDRRIFTPVARHTDKWDKAYNQRSSVERVNSRIDQLLGFEQHTIRGQKKMTTRMTLALMVMLAMALGRIRQGQHDQMRSLVKPVLRKAS